MSLSKQLLALISLLFLIIFSINFVLSVNNIRSYLEGEAEIHAQDTATSLGLSLSPYIVDESDPMIETTMNAIFDMGYYQEIKLVSVEDTPLVTLTNNTEIEEVPEWFINMIPMQMHRAESEISSGWSIGGVLYVTLNPGYAYRKLYEQAQSSFYYALITFSISISLLLLVLRITLSPLKRIDKMALTIAEGKFETIDKLPWTTEVKNVTVSMNIMSSKIEGIITGLNTKLNGIGKKLQQDDLTGLGKKSSFEIDMKKLFVADNEIDAFIFMIRIDGLASLVKELGNNEIDQFIKDFAEVLSSANDNHGKIEVSAYRFFGSEFCLLVNNARHEQTESVAKLLSEGFANVGKKYKKLDIAHIGVAAFNPYGSTDSILLAANEAYEQSQLIGANSYFIRKSEDEAKDISEWKSLIFSIIENQDYTISFVGQTENFATNELLMEDAFTSAFDTNGDLIAIGTFISIAEKFSKIVDLDKGVVEKVISYIESNTLNHHVAVNLSTRTIKNSDFRTWLAEILKSHEVTAGQIVFSIASYAIAKEVAVYKEFIEFVHSLNAKVMIKRFDTQSMSLDVAKQLNPDFIRLARDLSQDVAKDDAKYAFIETMQGIGELLDINILAENIRNENDFKAIKKIGLVGASR